MCYVTVRYVTLRYVNDVQHQCQDFHGKFMCTHDVKQPEPTVFLFVHIIFVVVFFGI